MDALRFKRIDHPRYKYELTEPFTMTWTDPALDGVDASHGTDWAWFSAVVVNREWRDYAMWRFNIAKGYAWDGPSGPTVDSLNWMRASLVHDALYQLMREGILPQSYRSRADEIMRRLAIGDGMSRFRAWYSWLGVRLGGRKAAKPKN